MANLQFLGNVIHNGIIFKGPLIKDNVVKADGMIVDLNRDASGLDGVAQNLIDRKLARYTNDPATHTSVLVSAAQEALPVDAPSGVGKAPAAAQAAASAPKIAAPNAPAPAQPQVQPPAQPQAPAKQPTAEEIAATANSVA